MFDTNFSGKPYDVFLDHRFRCLNRRRWIPRTTVVDYATCAHLPFMDRDVQDAYLSLPLAHVRCMRAHTLAVYLKDRQLGHIPLAGRPLPLWLEWRLGPMLSRYKSWRDLKAKRGRESSRTASEPSIYAGLLADWASGTASLDTKAFRDLLDSLRTSQLASGALINRLIAHCVIERLYVNREVASLPPFLLLDPSPRKIGFQEWRSSSGDGSGRPIQRLRRTGLAPGPGET